MTSHIKLRSKTFAYQIQSNRLILLYFLMELDIFFAQKNMKPFTTELDSYTPKKWHHI